MRDHGSQSTQSRRFFWSVSTNCFDFESQQAEQIRERIEEVATSMFNKIGADNITSINNENKKIPQISKEIISRIRPISSAPKS